MKIRLNITVDIDPKEWAEREAIDLPDVRDNVRSYFLHLISMSYAMGDVGGRAWIAESAPRPVRDQFSQPPAREGRFAHILPEDF